MSRGGRGGRGGGRGGATGSSRLNHGNVPFEIDAELEAQADGMRKDHGLFPPMNVPKPAPLDRRLRQQVEDYRDLQLKFRHGPFYRAGSHIGSRGGILKERKNKSVFNAFEDNPSYLKQRAARAREFMEAEFERLPWCREMFPKELWETTGAGTGSRYRPKIGRVNSKMDMKSRLDKLGDDEEHEQKEDKPQPDKDDESAKGDDDDEQTGRNKDDDQDSEEFDDTYEDGEDDMAGDYNAEQYFDGGDDDDGDGGYDGGGGDDL